MGDIAEDHPRIGDNLSVVSSVTEWNKPQRDDYDFDSWTRGATLELLEAGCLYEYARESTRLRYLLLSTAAAQARGDFKHRSSVDGLREENLWDSLGSAFRWLIGLTDQLADNRSFAELMRAGRDNLMQSLAKCPFRRLGRAVDLGFSTPFEGPPWPWVPSSISDLADRLIPGRTYKLPERHLRDWGSETIAIEVNWRDFNDKEIASEMKRFAKTYRPVNWKGPARQGKRPLLTVRAHLKDLSAMRIWASEPNQWKRLGLVAKVCGYNSCRKESTAYRDRCLRGLGDEPMDKSAKTEMSKARKHAVEYFQHLFPGEQPSNYRRKVARHG